MLEWHLWLALYGVVVGAIVAGFTSPVCFHDRLTTTLTCDGLASVAPRASAALCGHNSFRSEHLLDC